MNENKPLVSIGIPVYNEERYLAKTLDSLLAQDYPNIEIIISDNASTDATSHICKDYMQRNRCIRYYSNSKNLGTLKNFDRVLELSKGEFFMWAGSHDLWSTNFISACAAELQRHPALVLCHGRTQCIDVDEYPPEAFSPVQETPPSQLHKRSSVVESFANLITDVDTRGLNPGQRLCRIFLDPQTTAFWAICGLIRAKALKKNGPLFQGIASDYITLAQLSLQGEFSFTPCAFFYYRCNSLYRPLTPLESLTKALSLPVLQKKKLHSRFPFTRFALEMMRVVIHSSLPYPEKTKIMVAALLAWKRIFIREFGTLLPGPVKLAAKRFRRILPGDS